MTSEVETIGTQPPELLEAMLAMIRRNGCAASVVTGYRERSYNIGYCESCYEMVADVRIYYRRPDGAEAHYQCEYRDLGELIRELTKDADEQHSWTETVMREPADEHWERFYTHAFDEEP